MVFLDVDGKSFAKGTCKEGALVAEERDRKQFKNRTSAEKQNIVFDSCVWDDGRTIVKRRGVAGIAASTLPRPRDLGQPPGSSLKEI